MRIKAETKWTCVTIIKVALGVSKRIFFMNASTET